MGDTPTSPGIRLRRIALATLSWLYPIRRPRLWQTLIGRILCPYGAGTSKSERLPQRGTFRFGGSWWYIDCCLSAPTPAAGFAHWPSPQPSPRERGRRPCTTGEMGNT